MNHGDTEPRREPCDPSRVGFTDLRHKSLTDKVIGAAIEVHRATGPGLLASVYEECLCHEFSLQEIPYQRQVPLPVHYKGITLDGGFRLDLLAADTVVVERKAVERVLPVHESQLMTYMKLLNKPVGLLLNFNAPTLKDGIIRRVL